MDRPTTELSAGPLRPASQEGCHVLSEDHLVDGLMLVVSGHCQHRENKEAAWPGVADESSMLTCLPQLRSRMPRKLGTPS